MQFHETVMGKRFFEGQLPQLIGAVNNLTKAINENTAATANLNEQRQKQDVYI